MLNVGKVSYAQINHLNDAEKIPMTSKKGTLMVRIYLHLGKTAITVDWNLNRQKD